MFVGLHANLRLDVCCGDYILHLGKHEVYTFAEICIFSFKATPFTSKIQIYYSVVYSIIFMGVALHIITCPAPFAQGSLWVSANIAFKIKTKIHVQSVDLFLFTENHAMVAGLYRGFADK